MLKVWVVGSNGQIGTAINEVIEPSEIEVLNTDQDELDITNTDDVISFGEINRPDIIINCAAITDVYKCERNRDQAFRVNALGPRNLCIVARKIGAKVVQISTDDVFDGKSDTPYNEFDVAKPKTVYGCSKKAGEDYVKEFTHKHFIIRSNWIYGQNGTNFVNEFIAKSKKEDFLNVANEYGTYHITCKGVCSRYEFAKEISKQINSHVMITPVSTKEMADEVVRPSYVVLDNFILRLVNGYQMPTWQESLQEYIKEIKED